MLHSNRSCIVWDGGRAQMSLSFCCMNTFGLGIILKLGIFFSVIVSAASLEKLLLSLCFVPVFKGWL